jgi:hypothetical protein
VGVIDDDTNQKNWTFFGDSEIDWEWIRARISV